VHPGQCSRQAPAKPHFELGDIIREHADALRAQQAVTPEQARVLRALAACRTAALGGHLDRCLDCGYQRPAYNSCRNRHCPKCQALDAARWLTARMQTLLPVPYFHVVFTLPGELAPIVLRNRRRLFDLLFRAASETLLCLGRDPRRLGGQLGLTMVLHTWTRDLRFHPHVHAVVTGGGLSPGGERWIAADPDYLFPVRVLSRLFRGKMLALMRQEHQREPLDLPEELCGDAFAERMSLLYETEWVTYAKPPFAGPQQVLAYLGRYTHRVALSNHRLLAVTPDTITLRTRAEGSVALTPVELLRRFLLHLLPHGFVRIRHYGLLAASNLATRLAAARQILDDVPPRQGGDGTDAMAPASTSAPTPACQRQLPASSDDWRTLFTALTGIDTSRCPACGSQAWIRDPVVPASPHLPRAPPARAIA